MICFDSPFSENELKEKAQKNGIKILPLSSYTIGETRSLYPRNTFVAGFGGMTKKQMSDAVKLLENAWK